jgi:hypothetical protein
MASDDVLPSHSAKTAVAVHGQGRRQQFTKALICAMAPNRHRSHDAGELLKVRRLAGEKRGLLEERNNRLQQIDPPSHHEDNRTILFAIWLDVTATAEAGLDQLENLSPVTVLADVELGHKLKTSPARRIPVHDDREASFSVDIAGNVAVQPFLLIVRTRHIFTVPRGSDSPSALVARDTRSFQHIARFIDSKVYCLTTF